MSANPARLKAKIRNIAKDKSVAAQVILQNYMFERLLERIAVSEYRDRFILKGGMLIAAMVGLETRTTMDMDATLRAYPLDEPHIRAAMEAICSVSIDDDVALRVLSMAPIRKDDPYGGFRVALEAVYGTMVTPLSVDISVGDAITPAAVRYRFHTLFDATKIIELWAYNLESILAEKMEAILSWGALSTRPRDFYDVYILTLTQKYDQRLFEEALEATITHRDSRERIGDVRRVFESIATSSEMRDQWRRYQREFPYAANIAFDDTLDAVRRLYYGQMHE